MASDVINPDRRDFTGQLQQQLQQLQLQSGEQDLLSGNLGNQANKGLIELQARQAKLSQRKELLNQLKAQIRHSYGFDPLEEAKQYELHGIDLEEQDIAYQESLIIQEREQLRTAQQDLLINDRNRESEYGQSSGVLSQDIERLGRDPYAVSGFGGTDATGVQSPEDYPRGGNFDNYRDPNNPHQLLDPIVGSAFNAFQNITAPVPEGGNPLTSQQITEAITRAYQAGRATQNGRSNNPEEAQRSDSALGDYIAQNQVTADDIDLMRANYGHIDGVNQFLDGLTAQITDEQAANLRRQEDWTWGKRMVNSRKDPTYGGRVTESGQAPLHSLFTVDQLNAALGRIHDRSRADGVRDRYREGVEPSDVGGQGREGRQYNPATLPSDYEPAVIGDPPQSRLPDDYVTSGGIPDPIFLGDTPLTSPGNGYDETGLGGAVNDGFRQSGGQSSLQGQSITGDSIEGLDGLVGAIESVQRGAGDFPSVSDAGTTSLSRGDVLARLSKLIGGSGSGQSTDGFPHVSDAGVTSLSSGGNDEATLLSSLIGESPAEQAEVPTKNNRHAEFNNNNFYQHHRGLTDLLRKNLYPEAGDTAEQLSSGMNLDRRGRPRSNGKISLEEVYDILEMERALRSGNEHPKTPTAFSVPPAVHPNQYDQPHKFTTRPIEELY